MQHVPLLAQEFVERQFEFTGLPSGWAGVALIVIVFACLTWVFCLYRWEQRSGASRRLRYVLAGLRSTVLLMLVLVWLQPALATYLHRTVRSRTVVLVDSSASMSLTDTYLNADDRNRVRSALDDDSLSPEAMSRSALVEQMLSTSKAGLLNELAAQNPVVVYGFGQSVIPLGSTNPSADNSADSNNDTDLQTRREGDRMSADALQIPASAPASDVSQAIREAVQRNKDEPISAIVVLSDGQFNRGESPSIVGQFSKSKEIPVHTVAVGDPALPQNLTVQSVTAPSTVFVEDPFEITASLRAEGLIGTRAVVELIAIDDQQRDAVIDRKDISVDREGQLEPVRFEHQLEHPQPARLRVRIRSDQQETRDEDNAQTIRIDAIANKLRILLVAGSPTWEYRYLSRLLERDATVDLSCWLQSADPDAVRDGNTPLDHLPETLAELSPYDCFILLDPDPVALNMEWSSHVEKQITQLGAGLLYVAGRQYASRFARDLRTADLLSLLPVVIEPGESDLIINELGHFQVSDWPVEIPPAVVNHPVLKLSDDKSANVQIWNQLPGVYWHYPVSRSKPVATVFLRHSNPKMRNNAGGHVLLASQFVGSGRSGFLAYDQTWRWRRFGDRFYNRFWIQLIRHLVEGKLLSGQKRGLIQLEQDECTPGEAVMVEARLLNASHEAMDVPEVEAELLIDNRVERSVTLKATPNRPGWYRGQIIPTRIGTYDVRIQLPGQGDVEPATITAQLRVSQADLEMIRTQLNRKTLRTLAKSSAGGKMLEIDEADQLVSLIPRKTTTLVLSGEPVELWDRWWTLLALVALLGVEWALRKRYGLL